MSETSAPTPPSGQRRKPKHEALIETALAAAESDKLVEVLQGTIGDALTYCRAGLRQFDRRTSIFEQDEDAGQHFAECHLLLIVAHEAFCHAARVEQLLQAMGEDRQLPPSDAIRQRLRAARNLLAEHRDERVLYWRLTGQHTERVRREYERLGVPLPQESIDSERFDDDSELGDRWGTIGGLLSLPQLKLDLEDLTEELEQLASRLRPPSAPGPEPEGERVTMTFKIVGPITISTS